MSNRGPQAERSNMRATWRVLAVLSLAGCTSLNSSPPQTPPSSTGGTSPGTGGNGGNVAPGGGGSGVGGPGAGSTGSGGGVGNPSDGGAPPANSDGPAAVVGDGSAPPPPPGGDVYGTLPNGGGITESAKAFEDRIYDIQITIAPADWTTLNKNAELYDYTGQTVPAMVTIDGVDQGTIGIRYKGAWGTFRDCLTGATGAATGGGFVGAPIGGDCTNQLPMKLDFTAMDPNKRWNGLKKINLHNLITDKSKIRDKLSYQLFRGMKIPTARSTHGKVTLTVGGQSVVMLSSVTENETDGRFGADHWPLDKDGNVYKEVWPKYTTPTVWAAHLQTNTAAMPPVTHDKAMAFAMDVVNNASNPDMVLAAVNKWSDVAWLTRYLAVDTAISNVDGVTKFWCRPTAAGPLPAYPADRCANNNYVWYQTRTDKFLLVPWDLDNTWYVWTTAYPIPMWDQSVTDCSAPHALNGSDHRAPGCDPVFKALNLPAARAQYIQAIKDMLAGPFNVPAMQADVDRWATYLRPAVMATRSGSLGGIQINCGLNAATWDADVKVVRGNIQVLHDKIAGVVAGKPFRQ
jgi:hypothetical protein